MLFRRGTAVTFRNFLIYGFRAVGAGSVGMQIDNPATITQVNNGSTQVGAGVVWSVSPTPLHSSVTPFVASGRFPERQDERGRRPVAELPAARRS